MKNRMHERRLYLMSGEPASENEFSHLHREKNHVISPHLSTHEGRPCQSTIPCKSEPWHSCARIEIYTPNLRQLFLSYWTLHKTALLKIKYSRSSTLDRCHEQTNKHLDTNWCEFPILKWIAWSNKHHKATRSKELTVCTAVQRTWMMSLEEGIEVELVLTCRWPCTRTWHSNCSYRKTWWLMRRRRRRRRRTSRLKKKRRHCASDGVQWRSGERSGMAITNVAMRWYCNEEAIGLYYVGSASCKDGKRDEAESFLYPMLGFSCYWSHIFPSGSRQQWPIIRLILLALCFADSITSRCLGKNQSPSLLLLQWVGTSQRRGPPAVPYG